MPAPLAPQEPSKFNVTRAVVEQINEDASLVKINYGRIAGAPSELPPVDASVTVVKLNQDVLDYIAVNGGSAVNEPTLNDPTGI